MEVFQDLEEEEKKNGKKIKVKVNMNNLVRELFKTFNAFENLAEWGGKQRNDPGIYRRFLIVKRQEG